MTLTILRVAADSPEFALCFALRIEVFVEEQKVPLAEERDALDSGALHFLAYEDGEAIATARVIPPGAAGYAKITRVAVRAAARGRGIGAALMRAIEAAPELAGVGFVLDAQEHALSFYRRLGYVPQGETFMEAGIPHRRMTLDPQRGAHQP